MICGVAVMGFYRQVRRNVASRHWESNLKVPSDSTRRTDLGEKRDAYLTIHSLEVLLFVEPDFPEVTVHRRQPEGGFALEYHTDPGSTIPLPEIDAVLPLAELYERVEFAP